MENGEELLYRAVELKNKSEDVEKNLQFIGEQIAELEDFNKSVERLEKENEKEILANIGRGVFVKADRKIGEKLFVDIGGGILVRKTPKATRKIIEEQIIKFNEAKIKLTEELEYFAAQFRQMMEEVEKLKK